MRDDNDPDGFSRDLWRQMAELGWTGFLVSGGRRRLRVRHDRPGAGDGGRRPDPGRLAAVVHRAAWRLAAVAGRFRGAESRSYLPPLLAGEHIFALALEEGSPPCARTRSPCTAERDGSGYRLNGQKTFVLDGHIADTLIVAARTDGGITLFLVPGEARLRTRLTMVDSRNAASRPAR